MHADTGNDTDSGSNEVEQTAVPALSCYRLSPRPCANQALVDELKPLREFRFLRYGTHAPEAISYATAVSCIIGTPFVIETVEQAAKIPKVGEKLKLKIQEFLDHGFIQESREVRQSERYQVLKLLTSVHDVGYAKANELYDQGVRNLKDLRRAMNRPRIDSYLKYHADLQEKIPRSEVESILKFVEVQLNKVKPGFKTLLCGGYRRGKEFSNDVDILITYPHADGKERGVLQTLVDRLQKKGLIPPDGLLTLTTCGTDRVISSNRPATLLDALDKALIIFKHPANATTRPQDKYRRVDLVVTTWKGWGSAVVGWTGSTQFERDLRRHAKKIGYKFDSGGIRTQQTDEPVEAVTEKDVFRVLGLEYIPPEMRNADP